MENQLQEIFVGFNNIFSRKESRLERLSKLEELINECVRRLNDYNDSPGSIFSQVQSVRENRARHYRDLNRALPRLRKAFNKELEKIKFDNEALSRCIGE